MEGRSCTRGARRWRHPAPGTRHRFTVEDYHRMVDAGVLQESSRVELLDGEVLVMAPIGRRHSASVMRLTRYFSAVAGRAIVSAQGPCRLDLWSEPQPDVLLLAEREDFYAEGHAGPEDILLLVEVSHSTLRFDREVKLPKYAQTGVAEFWIVGIEADHVEVYTDPVDDHYARKEIHSRGGEIRPRAFPDFPVPVEAILP